MKWKKTADQLKKDCSKYYMQIHGAFVWVGAFAIQMGSETHVQFNERKYPFSSSQ